MADHSRPSYGESHSRAYALHAHNDNGFAGRSPADDHFVFRGAAHNGRDSNHRPYDSAYRHDGFQRAEANFSFSPRDVPTAHFPSPEYYRYSTSLETTRQPRPDRSRRGGSQRREGTGRKRCVTVVRKAFRPKAANSREILSKSVRGTTPELLHGMNQSGHARFNISICSDDNVSGDEDSVKQDATNGHPLKRIKTGESQDTPAPRWSNPDPYTALPPPETLGAPKKDLVQVIRKAKADAIISTSAFNLVSKNADFISFEADEEEFDVAHIDTDVEDSVGKKSVPARYVNGHTDALSGTSLQRAGVGVLPTESTTPIKTTCEYVLPMETSIPLASEDDYHLQAKPQRKSKKRKNSADSIGEILPEWRPISNNSAPWSSDASRLALDPALRLHIEICDFYEYVRPDSVEESARQDLVSAVERAVRQSNLPLAKSIDIQCFGSFAAGLYLPTADMDLVAVTRSFMRSGTPSFCQSRNLLHKLGANLRHMAHPGDLSVVAWARVPIVKFTDRRTGIKVDFSVENRTGVDAVRTFQVWKSRYPAMPIIVMLIKQLLAMRGLNEVFSGGIGGFTIICLVTSMMQLMPERQAGDARAEVRYGDLLLRFLDLYGNRFDIHRTGICMHPAGYFDKRHDPMPKQNLDRLTIRDPNNPLNDISGGSHRIELVLEVFRVAHAQLQRRLEAIAFGSSNYVSVLDVIIGGNYRSFDRHRARLRNTYTPQRPRDFDLRPVHQRREPISTRNTSKNLERTHR